MRCNGGDTLLIGIPAPPTVQILKIVGNLSKDNFISPEELFLTSSMAFHTFDSDPIMIIIFRWIFSKDKSLNTSAFVIRGVKKS